MSKENEQIIPSTDENQINNDKLEYLISSLYPVITQYVKDYNRKNSWVDQYSDLFRVKFPKINFNEGPDIFYLKLEKIFDLMEISHLYCKVTVPTTYKKETHDAVISSRYYLLKDLKNLNYSEYKELQDVLKNCVLYGNN